MGPRHFHVFSRASSRRACTSYFLWGTFYRQRGGDAEAAASSQSAGSTEFPSGLALLLIRISVLMVFSCEEEVLKGDFNT